MILFADHLPDSLAIKWESKGICPEQENLLVQDNGMALFWALKQQWNFILGTWEMSAFEQPKLS